MLLHRLSVISTLSQRGSSVSEQAKGQRGKITVLEDLGDKLIIIVIWKVGLYGLKTSETQMGMTEEQIENG